MAKKYNKNFVLNTQVVMPNHHQNHNVDRTIQIIQKLCPDLPVYDENLVFDEYKVIKEDTSDSFVYNEEKL